MTFEIKQTDTFKAWEAGLKDRRARTIIAARIHRVAAGLLGDVEPVGNGVSELKIHYGPGYRVYFKRQGNTIIVLLCGGDKSTQKRDIELAKQLAQEGEARDD
jgi:putative addiction module killer protein